MVTDEHCTVVYSLGSSYGTVTVTPGTAPSIRYGRNSYMYYRGRRSVESVRTHCLPKHARRERGHLRQGLRLEQTQVCVVSNFYFLGGGGRLCCRECPRTHTHTHTHTLKTTQTTQTTRKKQSNKTHPKKKAFQKKTSERASERTNERTNERMSE